ncbi:paramyosin, short form-like [Lutzomyia longipalpis]|uniref:paramyosin, short form-like n=1 Tax=Lutzomyia longipalpis TaxID=7200 RepID=UPI002483516F|nr:paramyosin, short form-like [Lutzomyia longipalpis]
MASLMARSAPHPRANNFDGRRESAEPQSSPADKSRSRVDKHRVNPLNVGQAVEAERIVRIIEEKTGIDRLIERNKRRRHEDNLKLLRKLNDIDLFAERFNLQETKKAVMGDYRQDVQMSKELKKAIRGKSANAISAALLAESTRNIEGHAAADHCLAEEGTFVRSGSMSRGQSESRYVRTMHVEFMDERAINQLEASVNNSLQEVKRELVNFNCKSSEIYHESRYTRKEIISPLKNLPKAAVAAYRKLVPMLRNSHSK